MKKLFIFLALISVVLLFCIYFSSPYINFYNSEFLHPLFWTLIPLTVLFFLSSFLKNIKPKPVFLTIFIFSIIAFIILSQVDTTCSPIVCIDRNFGALMLSSLFSIVCFIVLFIKNNNNNNQEKPEKNYFIK